MKRLKARFADRGSAMVETAIVLPILLLIAVGIFDVGRAYQTWAVVTNAAREGARVSILPNSTVGGVTDVVRNYMIPDRWSERTNAPWDASASLFNMYDTHNNPLPNPDVYVPADQPGYTGYTARDKGMGQMMIVATIVLQTIGFIWIKQVVKIEV